MMMIGASGLVSVACGSNSSTDASVDGDSSHVVAYEVAASDTSRSELGVASWAVQMKGDDAFVVGYAQAQTAVLAWERRTLDADADGNEAGVALRHYELRGPTGTAKLTISDDTARVFENSFKSDDGSSRTLELMGIDFGGPAKLPGASVAPRSFGVHPLGGGTTLVNPTCGDLVNEKCGDLVDSKMATENLLAQLDQKCAQSVAGLTVTNWHGIPLPAEEPACRDAKNLRWKSLPSISQSADQCVKATMNQTQGPCALPPTSGPAPCPPGRPSPWCKA
jgi:hypothetical protein